MRNSCYNPAVLNCSQTQATVWDQPTDCTSELNLRIVVWLPYTGYYFWHYKPNTTAWINQAEQTLQKMMSAMIS
ncbi:MAG: hypothetical protein QGI86_25725 [Candidatus Poribacteria bacterium]|nr:hypothetical protein [Candidatus Poribacteria bacterium]MDP6750719.1 hypothetical protein [Candidatus Poribacteria bacterium]MDP6999528.1 hypothetical protein [Candidatus Poribacteria bacterium]